MRFLFAVYSSLLGESEVPVWDPVSGEADVWWGAVFKKIEEENQEPACVLEKLVKLVCILPHGQAFVERGFSATKYIVDGRNSLSNESVIGQKLVLSSIRRFGGAHKVPITTSMMNYVKQAHHLKKEADKKEQERKRQATEDAVCERDRKKRLTEKQDALEKWEKKR